MFGLGSVEITILVAILVLFFGPKKIPELAKGIADAIKNLRQGFSDDKSMGGKK